MLVLGGMPFRVEPEDRLSPREVRALSKLPRAAELPASAPPPFRISLVDTAPFEDPEPPPYGPATVQWEEGLLRLRQSGFVSEVDVFGREGRLYRRIENDSYGIEATLRGALSARLPLDGGLPLHAAALVSEGQGLVFFGPSGAGKSTISGLWPGLVVSDELVAVTRDEGYAVAATGFWGTLDGANPGPRSWPLRALIELCKGQAFRLERLTPTEALRRLVVVTLVPPAPLLWSHALGAIGSLSRAVPCYRMSWTVEEPPFERLAAALRS